jgi:NADH-quinone oxidoreductase subunit N
MIPFFENSNIALSEVVILVTACSALLGDLFLKRRFPAIAFIIALMGLTLAIGITALHVGEFKTILLNGLYIGDDVGYLMKIFIYITVALSFIYSYQYIDERHMPAGDYYVLGLFSTLGMSALVSAHSLLTVFLGLELLSLPLYAMVSIRRTDSDASEAAMKYFIMGAIASGMLLYGLSLLYGATGKLDLLEIANAIAVNWQQHSQLLAFSLVFIVAGIAFKLATVPFHMWAPDVYQGAPTSVTLFISAAPKIAAMGMAFRLLTIALPEISPQWQQLLMVVSILSVAVGNLLALSQTNLKRLFAYSAISHMGYALFGILAATAAGYSAALYYVLIYSIMSCAAFGLLILMSRNGLEIEQVTDLKGLNKKNPWLAFMMMIVMFSMAGIPPTVGFFTKLLVLKALIDVNMITIAVVGLFFAVVGAFYYLRIVKTMYFDAPIDESIIVLPRVSQLIYSLNCLALLYWGIFPGVLISACTKAFVN